MHDTAAIDARTRLSTFAEALKKREWTAALGKAYAETSPGYDEAKAAFISDLELVALNALPPQQEAGGLDHVEQMAITEHLMWMADIDTEDADHPACEELCGKRACEAIGCVVDKYRRTHGYLPAPPASKDQQ